ncbi:MAG TPA: RNA polymerase sigma factor [Thermoanaerobaculia bacterium]|nr:RNA polymerase sigma factor [Thermoanaerobaculia bacterium]
MPLGPGPVPAGGADPEPAVLTALERGRFEEALSLLMRAYGSAVYRYCRQMTGDDDLAQEAHQMTFVQAYEGLPRFAGRSALSTWLFGIARHRCLDLLKVTRRRRQRFGEEIAETAAPGSTVEERLTERSRALALVRCLGRLAPRVRDTLLLRFQQGLSYPDIARLSNEKAPALQIRVARALPLLRRCLEEGGMAP